MIVRHCFALFCLLEKAKYEISPSRVLQAHTTADASCLGPGLNDKEPLSSRFYIHSIALVSDSLYLLSFYKIPEKICLQKLESDTIYMLELWLSYHIWRKTKFKSKYVKILGCCIFDTSLCLHENPAASNYWQERKNNKNVNWGQCCGAH